VLSRGPGEVTWGRKGQADSATRKDLRVSISGGRSVGDTGIRSEGLVHGRFGMSPSVTALRVIRGLTRMYGIHLPLFLAARVPEEGTCHRGFRGRGRCQAKVVVAQPSGSAP
jgi:hypothetical protein